MTCILINFTARKTRTSLRARLHTGKFSSDKKISFVLNPLVVHESLRDKEKLSVHVVCILYLVCNLILLYFT